MDWATDQLGKLIHAADKSLFGYGFTCPTCGERVRRRAGLERRPHFAHYSHSAKPDCENYHPSTYESFSIAARVWEDTPRTISDRISSRGGLFLDRSEGGRFSLILKLPRLKSDADVSGEVQIRSALGVRTYSASQLKHPQFLSVTAQVPVVEVSASSQLLDAVAAIEEDVSLFRTSGNIFHGGIDGGRLLAPGEPLEWGESYRLFSQPQLSSAPTELHCKQIAQGGTRGWFLYEVKLPPTVEDNASARDAITRYLGRVIRAPRPRAFLVDPIPHHIEPDGTYVYPSVISSLLLRRTANCEVVIEGSARTEATVVQEINSEWLQVQGLDLGEFIILIDGHAQVTARIDECELFHPAGVQVLVGDTSWEIFEAGLPNVLPNGPLQALAIQCPTRRIADGMRLEKEQWEQRGAFCSLRSPQLYLRIDAGNFGLLIWPRETPVEQPLSVIDADTVARRVWIEGLIARATEGDACFRCDKFWQARDLEAIEPSLHSQFSWLRPHINFARGHG